jgi:hypothetical protein
LRFFGWPSINLAVVEYHYARLFAVAKDWQYRIDHAVGRSSRDGTLARPTGGRRTRTLWSGAGIS